MKFLLLVVLVAAVVWWVRGARRRDLPPTSGRSADVPSGHPPEEMVACTECGVHLPRSEALPGRGGVFCGEAHRVAFERANAER